LNNEGFKVRGKKVEIQELKEVSRRCEKSNGEGGGKEVRRRFEGDGG
jgi:hypothetical protein